MKKSSFKKVLKILSVFMILPFRSLQLEATEVNPDFPKEGLVTRDVDNFLDKQINYAKFVGRITDKDNREQILKIHSETNNVKFFRAGDSLSFNIHQQEDKPPCVGFVRGTEKEYLVVYVKNLAECWQGELPFRRGTQINVDSKILYKRVIEASQYRKVLLKSRKDFLRQLNGINHFLWSFDQIKVKTAAEYDEQILSLKEVKQKALEDLLGKKEEKIVLQKELIQKLDVVDESLDYYRVERQEHLLDRWHLDHDLGIPVGKRPQDFRKSIPIEKKPWFQETSSKNE